MATVNIFIDFMASPFPIVLIGLEKFTAWSEEAGG